MDYENITERRILVFGDSNTYGYDPERDGRYGETERYPCRIQALLGPGWTVIEEGLPGRTAVFDDPVTEGLCGLSYLTPCMMSHAPLDTLVVMLGTNDTKERFGCNAYLIAQGIGRLLKKAADTDAWRDKPDILAVCPAPIVPAYESLVFRNALGWRMCGKGCRSGTGTGARGSAAGCALSGRRARARRGSASAGWHTPDAERACGIGPSACRGTENVIK